MLLIALFSNCHDMWSEKEYPVIKDIYIIESVNDGPRLCQKNNESSYSGLINSTVCQLFRKDNFLFVKADPETPESDTTFYRIQYTDSLIVNTISKREFDSLSKGLSDIVQKTTF